MEKYVISQPCGNGLYVYTTYKNADFGDGIVLATLDQVVIIQVVMS